MFPAGATGEVDKEFDYGGTPGLPAEWVQLRINVPKPALFCEYETRGGDGATDPTALALTEFQGLYATAPTTSWYFVQAQCNWANDSGGELSTYFQRGDVQQLYKNKEGM
jgi:hypothetical protein